MMKIYTRTGDDGTTSLYGGKRLPKHHPRIEACGTIDELVSWIGLLRSYRENEKRKEFLVYVQTQLMACASALALGKNNPAGETVLPDSDCVKKLENEIDMMEKLLQPADYFIVPGGNVIVSNCHIARCVCRRAERRVLKLNEMEKIPEPVTAFLNRLSDYLFVLAEILSLELGNEQIKWRS